MNQSYFELLYKQNWTEFAELLTKLESPKSEITAAEKNSFPALYRQMCSQYGLAAARHYSPALVDRLHLLVLRGHRQLYKKRGAGVGRLVHFFWISFPSTFRNSVGYFWIALLLFLVPGAMAGTMCYIYPEATYSIMGESQVASIEEMYDPANHQGPHGKQRDAEDDFTMFGYYIFNNVSIGFRTFAGGIIYGVGTVFFLVFNGIMIGGTAGHLSHAPFASLFWPFVSGHGAFELTAIIISGAAGLMVGAGLLFPGEYRRLDSLKRIAPRSLTLVMGAMILLIVAAIVEAFWSSSGMPVVVKYWVSACNWIVVSCYLALAGRRVK
ncbi:stage II sporulation protein M [Desulfogranum japonicum]|uniref:stage II sporulation protein M n=1 Tax=Desulfogranum japonicum TaxID=231447 RepID=UPI00042425B4|nr:stage II sporulation protein M [Desulfogranum japonicum]